MTSFTIPTLETDRLILRGPEPRDCGGFIDFFTSGRAAYVGDGPTSIGKAWRTFALELGHWQLRGFGSWAVTLRGSDTALGLVGGWHPVDSPEQEIGWLLWQAAEGKSIAYEAAIAARKYLYERLGWETAVSYIDPENARSIALAKRLGATLDPTAICKDAGDLVYRHPAPEALA